MRGHICKRSERSWTIILDVGSKLDPETSLMKRNQQWISVKGTKKQAEAKLAELLHRVEEGDFVEPSRVTFGEWLEKWFSTAIEGKKGRRTIERYRGLLDLHIKPILGTRSLQKLTATELEGFYASKAKGEKPLSASSLQLIHTVIHSALAAAERKRLVKRNEAKLVDGKPQRRDDHEDIKANCWEASEARAFLAVARKAGARPGAFYTVAIETGMRKAELCGLQWQDVDLEACRLTVMRQLAKAGKNPVFGPPKTGEPRTIDISADTVELLRELKRHQAEVKMANRTVYRDHGLVFTREWADVTKKTDSLGDPLLQNNIGQREFAKLVKAAEVPPIKFHGLRHTSATLALSAGVPIKVVQERLGHKNITITMDIYAHALPSMQREAASRIGSLLRG